MRKRSDTGRHSYRGDLVGQEVAGSRTKKPQSKSDRDAAEQAQINDSAINEITGDPYPAGLLRKQRPE
ncbi:MAG: hypothetical protein O6946_10145 [Gammaproteobacteria bacterium]|nr:hypothetical protein [Gammaproteobacteria bacterium]MCZ6717403.1 hypothetical protein [Gammaproteobacteria bacterium]